ncbi:58bd7750-8284-4cca-8698-044d9dd87a54 [Thermothielavioides terrestris]|uniref:58bd7750-8284-4cca-8698-044d9dd87a54 n=1 Tax=Thermothielavioides terrestris TaxID=2587410 RepID=A0A3S4F7F0_9PEZI|nr:58bd7750-8284-4cca-8698-044d9dd87a54 [Thermothielavioides terrestris]
METSAPKRRRTSPRTAVAVQPQTESEPVSTTPPDPPPGSVAAVNRPSFASPTRASLERFNPDILRRRESQPRRLRSSPDAPGSPSRAATPDSTGSLTRALRTRLELRSGTRDGRPPAGSDADGVLRSPPRRPARTPTTRPAPRPLPPPAPEHDEELLRAITERRAPGRSLGVLPELTVPEPELPPTPEHPDPVVSTPPSGIHNTPSRRPRRSRALAERLKSSSPLKQPSLGPDVPPRKGLPLDLGLHSKKGQPTGVPPGPSPTTAELRGLKPVDPDAEKKKLRDSLLAELSQLESDLDVISKENERIRQGHLSRQTPTLPANKDEILDVLGRHLLPPDDQPTKPDPVEDWLASALNPIAFLPFSKRSSSGPPTLPPQTKDEEPEDLPPPVSHHPLPMTVDEALPYLQVFTPLTFTAHVSPLPRADEDDAPLLQHHTITASSTSPRGLFTARIEMTVDTTTMTIASLAVPRLEPAAAAELGPFIDRIVVGGGGKGGSNGAGTDEKMPSSSSSSGLRNNVSVLGWAMGEWLRTAVQRARVWIALEREVAGGKDALREMVARQRARGRRPRRRRRRKRWVEEEQDGDGDGHAAEDGDGDEEDEDGDGTVDSAGKGYAAADLLPFMGRTCMDMEVPVLDGGKGETSALRVQWRITFDWTGEARSEIGVLVGLPGKWYKHDERGQLSGLPKLFDELIQGGEEPIDAVRTVVCLLAGEQRS